MIKHSVINSPFFKLLDAYNFDVMFGDDGYSLRVELFQDIDNEQTFRCLFWQTETVEVGVYVSSGDCHVRDEATYHILVDWAAYLSGEYSCFTAASPKDALDSILTDLRKYLVHASASED